MHERRETGGFPYVSLKGTEAGESILYKQKDDIIYMLLVLMMIGLLLSGNMDK